MSRPLHQVETARVGDLKPAPYNPRTINQAALKGLGEAVERWGLVENVVVNRRTGYLVGGHQRVAVVLAKEGPDAPVPVVYVDLDDTEERALNATLNNPAIQGTFDMAALTGMLETVKLDMPVLDFEALRLPDLLPEPKREPPKRDPNAVDDAPPSRVQLGDVVILGEHRLVCGDARDPRAYAALFDGAASADIVWTDPPYGVAVVGGSRAEPEEVRRAKGGLEIQNDDLDHAALRVFLMEALTQAFERSRKGAAWYVAAPSGDLFGEFAHVLGREGLAVWRHTIAWVKDRFVMGRADYHYRHESVFYGWRPGAAHYFVDDRTQDTVWEIDRPSTSKDHPTMKPVELIARALRNSSRAGEVVLDPFGGSGSTLIAAEMEGRVARLIELSPRYCDVIVARWEGITGKVAVIQPPK